MLRFLTPNARRCYKLGKSLRKAIQSYPEDLRVAIVATGGLSHQVHGERCGFDNTDWIGLIRYGAIFFGLEKMAAVAGVSNPHVYASMRGEDMETFQNTRNVSMQYSVAGGDNAKKLGGN